MSRGEGFALVRQSSMTPPHRELPTRLKGLVRDSGDGSRRCLHGHDDGPRSLAGFEDRLHPVSAGAGIPRDPNAADAGRAVGGPRASVALATATGGLMGCGVGPGPGGVPVPEELPLADWGARAPFPSLQWDSPDN